MLRSFWTTDLVIVIFQVRIVGEQFANHGALVVENRISTSGRGLPLVTRQVLRDNRQLSRFGTLIISTLADALLVSLFPLGFLYFRWV